jgi:hypothetical protein
MYGNWKEHLDIFLCFLISVVVILKRWCLISVTHTCAHPEMPVPKIRNRICGIMVSVLSLSAVDRGFEPRSGKTKDYKIGICCFSTKHAALSRFVWRKGLQWRRLHLLFFYRSYQVLLTDVVIIPRWAIQAPGSL